MEQRLESLGEFIAKKVTRYMFSDKKCSTIANLGLGVVSPLRALSFGVLKQIFFVRF